MGPDSAGPTISEKNRSALASSLVTRHRERAGSSCCVLYPSQVRPVFTHRWQDGLASSHFTLRILEIDAAVSGCLSSRHPYVDAPRAKLRNLLAGHASRPNLFTAFAGHRSEVSCEAVLDQIGLKDIRMDVRADSTLTNQQCLRPIYEFYRSTPALSKLHACMHVHPRLA